MKMYVRNILPRVGAIDRTEAVTVSLRLGLIRL
jgi:DNA-binding NarL/FixJ family response regulator